MVEPNFGRLRKPRSGEINDQLWIIFNEKTINFKTGEWLIEQKNLQPDLNGALFVERSGTKKREWKADKAAKKNKK